MIKTNGFLLVSNPRFSKRQPENRLDESFLDTILDKLHQCFGVANQRNMPVIFLGQLFDRNWELDPKLLINFFSLCSGAKHKPYYLVNSHELDGVNLVQDTVLDLINSTGLVSIIKEHGIVDYFDIDGCQVGLGASPYGCASMDDGYWTSPVEKGVWLMNDISAPISIPGIHAVINGCSISGKPSDKLEDTHYYYPGSMTRMHIEERDNTPSYHIWTPGAGMETKPLEHIKLIFSDPKAADEEDPWQDHLSQSQFVESLIEEFSSDEDVDISSVFEGDIDTLLKEQGASDEVRLIITNLAARAHQNLGGSSSYGASSDDEDSSLSM